MTSSRRLDPAGLIAGLLLLLLAGLIATDMSRLQLAAFYGVGPKAMPYVVAAGLAVLGLGNIGLALRGGFPARESLDLGPVFVILAGLVALMAAIAYEFGFILAATALFAAVARAFENRPLAPALRIGLIAAVSLSALAVAARVLAPALTGATLPGAVVLLPVLATLALLAAALLSRIGLLNVLIGFGIALLAYLLFARLLALTLPVGPLERLFA
jgi:putative tricarboxylic transport membrane protein